MSSVKERIIGAVTVMDEKDAIHFWELIQVTFQKREWNAVPEEAPDEIDLAMLAEIDENPECHDFLSSADALKELGLLS